MSSIVCFFLFSHFREKKVEVVQNSWRWS